MIVKAHSGRLPMTQCPHLALTLDDISRPMVTGSLTTAGVPALRSEVGHRTRLPRTASPDGASRSGSPPSARLPTRPVSPGWRLTRLRTGSFAAESLPDHPREPIDEYRGEPNGHHREPRQRPR